MKHLHLHPHILPYHRVLKSEYPISKGREPKGLGWFVEVDQATEILQWGKTIGVFPHWCGDPCRISAQAHRLISLASGRFSPRDFMYPAMECCAIAERILQLARLR